MGYREWEVASKLGKREKGMKNAKKRKGDGDGQREVLLREITGTFRQRKETTGTFHQCQRTGYDPHFRWVEDVAEDIA